MKRRDFLALSAVGLLAGCAGKNINGAAEFVKPPLEPISEPAGETLAETEHDNLEDNAESGLRDQLETEQQVEYAKPLEPIVAKDAEFDLLVSTRDRLDRVMRHIGFAHFNAIGFDAVFSVAKASGAIGAFTAQEKEYIEKLFYRDAKEYGFFGEKVTKEMTATIDQKEVFKVPYTGHYLYKGHAAKVYERVKKDVGETIFLTSGARGNPKQTHLFLTKTIACGGDYSEASHSLAPAGYSYHGVGDFDVGKVGYGKKNFTQDFAHTKEYELLMQLGYIAIRYPRGNPFGVYFEPWHVEVV